MGNEVYEESATASSYVCNGLFSIGEDGFGTRRMASVWVFSREHQNFKRLLPQFIARSCTSNEEFNGG